MGPPPRTPLTDYIEKGLLDQLPPEDEHRQLLVDMKLERRAYGRGVVERTRWAAAPFALTLSMFAVEGPMDLLLTVIPAHKLGKLYGKGKEALRLSRAGRLTQKHLDELDQIVGQNKGLAILVERIKKLSPGQCQALFAIHRRTGSGAVSQKLLRHQIDYDADVQWIAARLAQAEKHLGTAESAVLVRRFTFDKDLLEDITLHRANPSWAALQKVVENQPIAPATRASLVSKIQGLLGERAAYERLRDEKIVHKLVGRDDARLTTIDRGVPYGRGSMDLVAYTEKNEMLVAEVKNWSASTWADPRSRAKLIEQLQRHDNGIPLIRRGGDLFVSDVAAKVLFVAEDGFKMWGKDNDRRKFRAAVHRRGWVIEFIPNDQIRTFGELVDAIR